VYQPSRFLPLNNCKSDFLSFSLSGPEGSVNLGKLVSVITNIERVNIRRINIGFFIAEWIQFNIKGILTR
jgi:hypothetical protein